MITHSLNRSWTSSGGASIGAKVSVDGGAEINVDETIGAGVSNRQVAFALDVSQLKSLFMISDQPVTVKTNSSGSPDNTFTLAAGKPFAWIEGDPALRDTTPAAVTVDITTLYVTVPGATAARVRICALFDPTV